MHKTACVAMDIGGTNIRLALISRDGSILLRSSFPCKMDAGLDIFLQTISTGTEKLIGHAARNGIKVAAVGAGVPGLIESSGNIISAVNLPPLDGFNLQQWLRNELGLPVTTLNDANAAAVA